MASALVDYVGRRIDDMAYQVQCGAIALSSLRGRPRPELIDKASTFPTLFLYFDLKVSRRDEKHMCKKMGFLKNLSDKAKAKVGEIKSNVSKEDLLDLVSDARKTLAEGNGSDSAKWKAMGSLAMGLGKMASGKHQGSKEILENMHKDPYDIQMAEETKAELNSTLIQLLNPRKFIYGNPDVINEAGQFIVSNMHFINLVNDKTLLPKIHEYLNEKGIHYDEKTLDSEINKFIRSKDATEILAVREHVDKYIFIDRMTKEEILSLNKNYHYNMEKHYLYKCEYCGMKFEDYPTTSSSLYKCDRHPAGVGQGPHKLHSIGQEKLWVD